MLVLLRDPLERLLSWYKFTIHECVKNLRPEHLKQSCYNQWSCKNSVFNDGACNRLTTPDDIYAEARSFEGYVHHSAGRGKEFGPTVYKNFAEEPITGLNAFWNYFPKCRILV